MKRILKSAYGNIIGKIEMFLNYEDIPNTNLELNGQTVLRADYPDLALKIEKNPKAYEDFKVTETQIILADWQGYHLVYDSNSLGEKKTDTMRRTKGFFGEVRKNSFVRSEGESIDYPYSAGVFEISKNSASSYGVALDRSGDKYENAIFHFDSALGIEGQEGTESPNVGAETAPKRIGVIYTIRAKNILDFENLVFKEIEDFTEIESMENKYFLTDSGEKCNLSLIVKAVQKALSKS